MKFVYARFPEECGISNTAFNHDENIPKGTSGGSMARMLCMIPESVAYHKHLGYADSDSYLPFWEEDYKRLCVGDDKGIEPVNMAWLLSNIKVDGCNLLSRLCTMCDDLTKMKWCAVRDWVGKEIRCGMRFFLRYTRDDDGGRFSRRTMFWGTEEEVKRIETDVQICDCDASTAADVLVYAENKSFDENGICDGFACPLVSVGDADGAAEILVGDRLDAYCAWLESRAANKTDTRTNK